MNRPIPYHTVVVTAAVPHTQSVNGGERVVRVSTRVHQSTIGGFPSVPEYESGATHPKGEEANESISSAGNELVVSIVRIV